MNSLLLFPEVLLRCLPFVRKEDVTLKWLKENWIQKRPDLKLSIERWKPVIPSFRKENF